MMLRLGENWINAAAILALSFDVDDKGDYAHIVWMRDSALVSTDWNWERYELFEGQAAEAERIMMGRRSMKLRIEDLEAEAEFFRKRAAELEKKVGGKA
jgi:hypothetical protein